MVREVKNKKDLTRFVQFPHKLYKNCRQYVPVPDISLRWMLSKKNPFLQHSKIALFIAERNGEIIGRIAAVYNKTHLEVYNDHSGFFGFFDCINEQSVANTLFDACADWLSVKKITRMTGPANLTTNDSCGFLTKGFEHNPMVLMPYNFSYYDELCQMSGFKKSTNLFSYRLDVKNGLDNYKAAVERAQKIASAKGISIRSVTKHTFGQDMKSLRTVYNRANQNGWAFMPLSEAEFKSMAKDLKMITPLKFALIAENNREQIGFLIAVPNINEILQHFKNGALSLTNIIKYLWYRKTVRTARIMILGVLPEYRKLGVDLLLYNAIREELNSKKYTSAEACYVFENNKVMNAILKKLSGDSTKTYKMYEKDICCEMRIPE